MPLDKQDLINVQMAIDQGGKIWENEILAQAKRKIKLHHMNVTGQQCCYCRRDTTDEFLMVIDIEHVLPKSIFPELMFELFNLSVSCKRCNMRIKGDKTDFLLDQQSVQMYLQDGQQYYFIHPNADNYFDHISYVVNILDNKKSIKYVVKNEGKGRYTYKYFELEKLEVETLNKAQGIDVQDIELSLDIPKELLAETKNLIDRL